MVKVSLLYVWVRQQFCSLASETNAIGTDLSYISCHRDNLGQLQMVASALTEWTHAVDGSNCSFKGSSRIHNPVPLHPTEYLLELYLQSILEQLVHLGHLGRDGQVDGAVANLNDESATDLGVDLGDHLESLAVEDVLRLGDGGLETAEGPVVEGLLNVSFRP